MSTNGAGGGGAFPAQRTTSTSATRDTNVRFDRAYPRTLPGLLKITECALDLLGFICVESSAHSTSSTGAFFDCVAMGGFWFSAITFALYLFHVVERFHRVPWPRIEIGFCAAWTLLYVLAACLAATFGSAAFAAAAFFGFGASVAHAYDGYVKWTQLRAGRLEQGAKVVSKETRSPADA